MRGKDFLDKMEFIDSELIEKAEEKPKKYTLKRLLTAAACICILAVIPILATEPEIPQHETADPGEIAPNITGFDGRKFFISSYADAISNELPEGFEYAGETDVSGFENIPYYTNPEAPEWIYVYHEVRTNGAVDSTGTIIPAEPHNAYVRYVDERIRGAHLLFIDGNHYISMWSAQDYGSFPDVSHEYYEKMETTYGIRIEGDVPNGFTSIGIAEFSGNDTIPRGMLSSNVGAYEIYADPSNPDVILVATTWHTAPVGETGETNHFGFNIFIRYDCPLA